MPTARPDKALTILSIEDDPDTIGGALDALRAAGHRVEEATDDGLARSYLAARRFDFVLSDSLGTQTIVELKNGELGSLNADVPFAFLTAVVGELEQSNVTRLSGFLGSELKGGDVGGRLRTWTRSLAQQQVNEGAGRPKQVFLSHASHDKELALNIAGVLRTHGVNVWLDAYLPPGEAWQEAIDAAMAASDAFILLIGGSQSGWGRFELTEVVKRIWEDRSVTVLPIAIGDAELPGFLRDTNVLRVDPETGEGIETVLHALSVVSPVSASDAGRERLKQRLTALEQRAASADLENETE